MELIPRSPRCSQPQLARIYLATHICQVIITTCQGSTTISLPQQFRQFNHNLNRLQAALQAAHFALAAVAARTNHRCNRLRLVLILAVEQSPSHSPSLHRVIRWEGDTLIRCKCNTNKSCLVCLAAQDKHIRCKCSTKCIMVDHMVPLPARLNPSHRM